MKTTGFFLHGTEMDQIKEKNMEERIQELFWKESVSTIVLAGKAGIGKSWMAKKVSVCALKEEFFDIILGLFEREAQEKGPLSVYSWPVICAFNCYRGGN